MRHQLAGTLNMPTATARPRLYGQAARFLSRLDADWARHIDAIGRCLHEVKPARDPYQALVRAIAYQQLHARAGDAILARLLALTPEAVFPSPRQLLDTAPEQQRACGFSAAKLATIRAIAQATLDGIVPTREQALSLDEAALIERLTALKGVGRWTADMCLIYGLGHLDILPGDDFGVREGYRRLKALDKAPTPGQMCQISQAWQPYRTIAAWYLWRAADARVSA